MGGAASFLRPVGPAADVKELEYITSLHQATEPREDGSITGTCLNNKRGNEENVVSLFVDTCFRFSLKLFDVSPTHYLNRRGY